MLAISRTTHLFLYGFATNSYGMFPFMRKYTLGIKISVIWYNASCPVVKFYLQACEEHIKVTTSAFGRYLKTS